MALGKPPGIRYEYRTACLIKILVLGSLQFLNLFSLFSLDFFDRELCFLEFNLIESLDGLRLHVKQALDESVGRQWN